MHDFLTREERGRSTLYQNAVSHSKFELQWRTPVTPLLCNSTSNLLKTENHVAQTLFNITFVPAVTCGTTSFESKLTLLHWVRHARAQRHL